MATANVEGEIEFPLRETGIERLEIRNFDHYLNLACHSRDTEVHLVQYKNTAQGEEADPAFVRDAEYVIKSSRGLKTRLETLVMGPENPCLILSASAPELGVDYGEIRIEEARMRVTKPSMLTMFESLRLSPTFIKTLSGKTGIRKSVRPIPPGAEGDKDQSSNTVHTLDYCYTLFNWNTDVNVTKKTLPIVVYMKTDFQTGRPILLMCLNLPDRKFKALKTVDVSGATNTSILTDVQMALLRLQLEGYFSDTTVIHALSMLVGPMWLNSTIDDPRRDHTHHMRNVAKFIESATEQQAHLTALKQILEVLKPQIIGIQTELPTPSLDLIEHHFALNNLEQDIQALEMDLRQRKEKLEYLQTMVFHATALKSSKMANATSDSLAFIARRSAEDSEDMKTLTILARDDAKVMKFIAVLTMIYLPSSALSAIFSMNLLNFDSTPSKFLPPFTSSRYIFFYLALAIPTTLLTLGIGWYYSHNLEHERLKSTQDAERLKLEQEQQGKTTTSQQLSALLANRDKREELIRQWQQENPVATEQAGRGAMQALARARGGGAAAPAIAPGVVTEVADSDESEEMEEDAEELDPTQEAEAERRKKSLNEFLTVMEAIMEGGKDATGLGPAVPGRT